MITTAGRPRLDSLIIMVEAISSSELLHSSVTKPGLGGGGVPPTRTPVDRTTDRYRCVGSHIGDGHMIAIQPWRYH